MSLGICNTKRSVEIALTSDARAGYALDARSATASAPIANRGRALRNMQTSLL